MMVELQLPPDLERHLLREAARVGSTLEDYVLIVLEKYAATIRPPVPALRRRQPGAAKGLIRIGDDFDEPLKDFEPYR